MRMNIILSVSLAVLATTAHASPGVADPVYAAVIEPGVTEVEARYARLTGGTADGADGLVVEVDHGFSDRWSAALLIETGRDPGGRRIANAAAFEAVYHVARVAPLALDIALYGEYKLGLNGNSDAAEGKLLLQHRAGPFDARVNLIAERPLIAREPVELSYAASVDWAVAGDDLRVGLAAFGDLGTTHAFGGRQELYIGPTVKLEIERLGPGEFEVEAGWLRAFSAARDITDGQARLLIGYEWRF